MGIATTETQRKVTPYLVKLIADEEEDIKTLPYFSGRGMGKLLIKGE